jgi:ribosomal protein S18 acetylase RimI-like enzyme
MTASSTQAPTGVRPAYPTPGELESGMDLELPLRRATPNDAKAMAELINMAGEGLPLHVWRRMAEPGEDLWEVGRRRAQREEGSFSYRNTVVVEEEGEVVAGLVGYALPDQPEPIDPDKVPGMFVPLLELENLAPATWYVNVLAAYPEHRGKGHGRKLLAIAERIAAEAGTKRMSIIVSDANTGAWRLYERAGYQVVAQRPMVKDDWENPGENWVLLVKPL